MNAKMIAMMLVSTLLLAGCGSSFKLPWDEDVLDAKRINTREPLEIPPDLQKLPPVAGGAVEGKGGGGENASAILFNTPPAPQAKPLTRNQREKLPGWLGEDQQVK
jgi:hypothetical protein